MLISVLTHLPPSDLPAIGPSNDKLQHLLAYGLLSGMGALAVWVTFPRRPMLLWGILLIGLAYGAIDEQTQKWVGRNCDLYDWFADAAGTMLGLLPVMGLRRILPIARVEGVAASLAEPNEIPDSDRSALPPKRDSSFDELSSPARASAA